MRGALTNRAGAGGALRRMAGRLLGHPPPLRQTVQEYFTRHGGTSGAGRYQTIHAPAVAINPLPQNVASRGELPDDRGWWGYSFRDVPERPSGETFIATLPDCTILWYRNAARANDFYPAIVAADGCPLDLRELRFRDGHADVLRGPGRPARLERATWILERVYHNHSHWLTAHMPKLLLLRDRGALSAVQLPRDRSTAIDASLRMAGLDPSHFPTFDPDRPLRVAELTVVGTDRFRPELLRLVAGAYQMPDARPPMRKVFISRARAARRRLLNEDAVWPRLERAGFDRVAMEDLSFEAQVALMRETAVLAAPHGAGLTNMLFCSRGCDVIEMADLSFPNPNFYALAAALGHRYWLVSAESVGIGHPLDKDLQVDPDAVSAILPRVSAR